MSVGHGAALAPRDDLAAVIDPYTGLYPADSVTSAVGVPYGYLPTAADYVRAVGPAPHPNGSAEP